MIIIKNYDKQHLELDYYILSTNTTLSAKINEVKSEILLKRIKKYY